MQDWLWQSATELGAGIARGEIDPVALTQTYLDAIRAHPLRDRIYTVITQDRALAEASAAAKRAAAGQRLSPLDGVPISWKDLFDSAGIATEAGSALLKGRTPKSDAEVLKNATALGLVCLGKTHMSELAFSGLGYNPITATPPCVNFPNAAPGGSSSGAAASVAFGLAAAAVGSDTGGSVRVPSSFNDLVGLKTTAGRISCRGVVPLCAKFDTIGPLVRSVSDAAAMLAVLEGTAMTDLSHARLDGVRLAVLTGNPVDDVAPEPSAGFNSAVERLEDAGANIDRIEIPFIGEALDLGGILFTSEAYGTWKHAIEANPDAMFNQVLERFRAGATHKAPDYVAAWHRLDELRGDWAEYTSQYDAVLCPTTPILPPKIDRLISDPDYYLKTNLAALRHTRIGNMFGLSALTLPTGLPSCGIMFLGAPMAEERLLRIGAAAEAALS